MHDNLAFSFANGRTVFSVLGRFFCRVYSMGKSLVAAVQKMKLAGFKDSRFGGLLVRLFFMEKVR